MSLAHTTAHRLVRAIVGVATLLALTLGLAGPLPAAAAAGTGTITGTVTTVGGGTPIAGVEISVETSQLNANGSTTWTEHQTIRAHTAADGTYTATVPPGTQYRVGFHASGFLPQYYFGASTRETADNVVVVENQTTAGINAGLSAIQSSLIKGRIRNPDGTPYTSGGTVQALTETVPPGQTKRSWQVVATDSTLVDGNYELPLSQGTYRLRVTLPDGSKGYLPALTSLTQADSYDVLTNDVVEPADLILPWPGTLSGIVRDGNGDPVGANAAQIEVLYDFVDQIENGVPIQSWERVAPASTDRNGRFSIRLLPRAYKVRINTPGLGRQFDEYYRDEPATAAGLDRATIINLDWWDSISLTDIYVGEPTLIRNTAPPWVSGPAKAGSTLTANPGTFNPAGTSLSLQWLADGAPISGATGPTYNIPALGGAGKRYAIRVTAFKAPLTPVTVTSLPTSPAANLLANAPFENRALPTISGEPVVSATLTASPGQWSEPATSVSYQWAANGVDIAGASGTTYKLTEAELGKRITVRATATSSGRTASGTSAPTAVVTRSPVTNETLPSITGSATVGSVLTAMEGAWTPTPTSFGYQWLADGAEINGATSKTYTVRNSDVGKRLSVRVTARATGFPDGEATSQPTAAVTGEGITVRNGPRILGQPRRGALLTANPGQYAPAALQVAYQWVRGKTGIPGANARTYRLTSADLGKRISVRVAYYTTPDDAVVRASRAIGPVKSKARLLITKSSLGRAVRLSIDVVSTGVAFARGSVKVLERGRVLRSARLSSGGAELSLSLPYGRHRLRVVYSGETRVAAARSTVVLRVSSPARPPS